MDKVEKAILKTLSYGDVFEFPLKKAEVFRFLISNKKINKRLVSQTLLQMKEKGMVGEKAGLFFLKGREKIFKLRRDRQDDSKEKLKIAKRLANFLKIIPFVKMVAATGALAMKNSKRKDDIDLLIVSKKGRLWTTRFLVTILVDLVARRRRPGDKNVTNKICLNMFLDEENLAVPKKEQDLFSAHEVVQLKPLWDKDNTYQKFLKANQWVGKFLPNATIKIKYQKSNIKSKFKNFFILIFNFSFWILNFAFIEKILKRFQLFYMSKRRTTEVVLNGIIRFHPKDARVWVLKEYQKRVISILD